MHDISELAWLGHLLLKNCHEKTIVNVHLLRRPQRIVRFNAVAASPKFPSNIQYLFAILCFNFNKALQVVFCFPDNLQVSILTNRMVYLSSLFSCFILIR